MVERTQQRRAIRASFTQFLRDQRHRLAIRWSEGEARIREAKQATYSLETRKAGGTAALVNGVGSRFHKIGGDHGGMAPAVFGVDDRDTNEGWH